MATIEQLRALERAATAGPIELVRYPHGGGRAFNMQERELVADFFSEGDRELYTAARAALPALLKVAEAAYLVKAANARRANAQVQDCCERIDYEKSMGHACDQLTRALEELEAQ
jgi:hypothetical protein